MDISDSLSTNSVELDETMGGILSASNENEVESTETDPPAILAEESTLTSQNVEVNELQSVIESDNLADTTDSDVLDNVTSYTETLSDQDINLIIMGKPSVSNDDSEEIISSSEKITPSTSHIEEHEELWLGDNTRQLVKVDTDEDFEVIVKSLETAIVETERYDIETEITTTEEPVISNSENSLGLSIIEADGHSLLEDIPSDLLTSTVPPMPLQEVSEEVELTLGIPDSPVEIIQHRSIDTYEEFAAISEPTVESLDEQSSSLFEVLEPEIDLPVDDEPSLLEIQEATMPTDIPEEFICKEIEEEITTKENELEICPSSVDSENPILQDEILSDMSHTIEESSEIVAESSEIIAESPDIVAESPEAIVESPAPISEPEIVANSPETVVESSDTVVESSETIVESSETVVESSETVAESPTTITELPELITELIAPATGSKPIAESAEVIEESSEVIGESSEVIAESSEIITESSEVIAESAEVITESAEVIAESSEVITESAEVIAESSEVITESAEVIAESSEVIAESAEVIAESSEVIAESAEVIAESSEVIAESAEVIAESSEVIAESSEVIAESSEVIAESAEVIAESSEVIAESAEVIAESPVPLTESLVPDAESPANSPTVVADSTAPIEESLAPTTESPTPAAESPTPVVESSTSVVESPTPVVKSPSPTKESLTAKSPVPVAESPEPIAELSELVSESPVPDIESPAPLVGSLVPYGESESESEPEEELPKPVVQESETVTEELEPVTEIPVSVKSCAIVTESPETVTETPAPIAESPDQVEKSPIPAKESTPVIESRTIITESSSTVAESPTPVTDSSSTAAESSPSVTESPILAESSTPGVEPVAPLTESPSPVAESTAALIEPPTSVAEIAAPHTTTPTPDVGLAAAIEESLMETENVALIEKKKETISEVTNIAEIKEKDLASKENLEEIQISQTEIIDDKTEENASTLDNENKLDKIEDNLIAAIECSSKIDEVPSSPNNPNENKLEIKIVEDTNVIISKDKSDCKNTVEKIDETIVEDIEEIQNIDENKSEHELDITKDTNVEISEPDLKNEIEVVKETNLEGIQEQPDCKDEVKETEKNISEPPVVTKEQLDDQIIKAEELNVKDLTQKLQTDEESTAESNKFVETTEIEKIEVIQKIEENVAEKIEKECASNSEDLSQMGDKISDTDKLTKISDVPKIESQPVVLSNKEELSPSKSETSKSVKHSLESDEKEQSPPKKIKLVREKFQSKSTKSEKKDLSKNIARIEPEKKIIPEKIDSAEKDKNIGPEKVDSGENQKNISPEKIDTDEKEKISPEKISTAEKEKISPEKISTAEKEKISPEKIDSDEKQKISSEKIESAEKQKKISPEKLDSVENEKTSEEIINIQVEKPVAEGKETIEQILEKLEGPSDKSESKSPIRAQKLKLQRNYKLPQKSAKQEKSAAKKIVVEPKHTVKIKPQTQEPTIPTVKEEMSVEKIVTQEIKIPDKSPKETTDTAKDKDEISLSETNKSIVEPTISTTESEASITDEPKDEIKSVKPEVSPIKEIEIEQSVQKMTEIVASNDGQEIIESFEEVMDTSSIVDKSDDKNKNMQEVTNVDISKDVKGTTKDNSIEKSSHVVSDLVDQSKEEIVETNIIETENNQPEANKNIIEDPIELQTKMDQEEQDTAIASIKMLEDTSDQEITENIVENIDNADENKTSDMDALPIEDKTIATSDEKIEVPAESSLIEESSDEDREPEMLPTEEPLKEPEVDVEPIVSTTQIKLIETKCTKIDNKKLEENTEEKIADVVVKEPEVVHEIEMTEENIVCQKMVHAEKIKEKSEIKISTKVEETFKIANVVSLEKVEDKPKIVQKIKDIEKEQETDVIPTESAEETQVSMATQKLIEIMQKQDKQEIETETKVVNKDKVDKAEPVKKELLTMNTEFPLLSSRLQERHEPKRQKLSDEVKITSVSKISQEYVSKKLQQELTITKEDARSETTSLLAHHPEISFTKDIRSAVSDHSATMESATKIKITKRKLATPEPTVRSVTKPLSVQIDDGESSTDQRSHSYGGSGQKEHENIPKLVIKSLHRSEGRSSPKITIKPIKPPEEMRSREESSHSPKITIKPIVKPDPLKITITKQKSDDTHSILKIYQPEDSEQHVPKLTIKPIPKDDMQHSPRITIKAVKPSSMSPKITVKPIPSPSEQVEITHSPKTVKSEESYPKVTIKPVLRPEETHKVSQLSPRQIKLKSMTFESSSGVTVEPVTQKIDPEIQTSPIKISVKSFAKMEDTVSPKLTIKPITKTCEIVQSEDGTSNPLKLTIKPILKPEETSYQSPKITIKPIVKPDESEDVDKPERIILKIQKNNLPSPKERKESKKEPEVKIEAIPHDSEKCQKLDKIKLKLTKEGSHAQIIPSISTTDGSFSLKRSFGITDSGVAEKRSKSEFSGTEILHTSDISINIVEPNAKPCPKSISEEVTIMKIDKASGSRELVSEQQISQSKFKEMLMKIQQKPDITCTPHVDDYSSSSDDVKIVEVIDSDPLKDPLSLQDDSNSQDVVIVNEVINTNPFQNIQIINAHTIEQTTPKKRGRPRKNPLEVKPEIKGEDCIEVRPKRTCRAPPGRTPFVVKERKPRGAGRGRGGSRGRGASKSPQKSPKETKTTPRGKALKEAKALAKIEAARLAQEVVIDEITIEDSTNDTPAATPIPPAEDSPKKPEVKCPSPSPPPQMVEPEEKIINEEVQINEEVKLINEEVKSINEEVKQPPPPAVYEEETRMSADNSSRAQTPARQVFTAPLPEGPEESQSSVQSTATTESSKTKKGRLEVIDPDSAVTTVEQIVEYSWANGGPYMLQEQIAQFLGVKSFKRKYPGLTRRPVEMQERDYIREKGLVHESMCDMGLTAVPSSEILDIMYSDFQEKYEEYRKCLRDKQAKEISNKQKAVSLATSQEKNKIDFKERAIRSAASWNLNFNKARKDGRKCCMDLQTFTINYPAGKIKVPQKTPVGHYPLALVPGQYTDYFKSYTPNELNYLPLNTVRYGPVLPNQLCDPGQSDGSQSDSDSSSGSDSDSSDDSMSTEEESQKSVEVNLTQLMTTPKSKVH